MEFSQEEMSELQAAKYLLENPGVAAKLSSYLGKPIEWGIEKLPSDWSDKIGEVTTTSLSAAAEAALFTMKDVPGETPWNIMHMLGASAAGALGGFFGFSALALEMPVTTTIMLRSILDIARGQGESISDPEVKMACLEVFAHGSDKTASDDAADSGYFFVRATVSNAVRKAAAELAAKGGAAISKESNSALLKAIAVIAARFSIEVTEKAAAQIIPVIGAVTGAGINAIFMDHYQDIARGHFTMRKLIRRHGEEQVKALYNSLPIKPSKQVEVEASSAIREA